MSRRLHPRCTNASGASQHDEAIVTAASIHPVSLKTPGHKAYTSLSLTPLPPSPPITPESHLPTTEFAHLKSFLAPLHKIYTLITTTTAMPRTTHITITLPTTNPYPIYTLHTNFGGPWMRGAAAFPRDTPRDLQLAISKLDCCDESFIHARVDWLIVTVTPQILLHYSQNPAALHVHSVILVTSASGNQYIADFSIEQFGFDTEMWFMPRVQYEQRVTDGSRVHLAQEE
ncbi:hypothetical protein CC86DRAFT_432269 [Ophiobolus disseminans]|uniref:Uncharacterized protein n=1 Tax=Ophiobolus disseminans TaxID=1469910 RepID=A0A6A6ZG10_9PLEO|nr:hypothetical protein CC86DRAFT_432269 [Ophiobolus disseminans]